MGKEDFQDIQSLTYTTLDGHIPRIQKPTQIADFQHLLILEAVIILENP